jgi:tellurite resistance protein TerC
MGQHTVQEWVLFHVLVFSLLALDLGVFNKKNHVIHIKEALGWSAFWIFVSGLFGLYVYNELGHQSGIEYFTGYVVEKSLSVDNLFVFAVIFEALKIERKFQHRLLFWGILGAIIMRAIMVALGASLLHNFESALYVFGAFLIWTGIKIFKDSDGALDPRNTPVFRFLQKKFAFTTNPNHNGKFFITEGGQRRATMMLFGLVLIEASDVLFALDSVPAVFGVTRDPYIVYTSNIFAILGLRSLFFALEELIAKFHLLKPSLAVVLIYVGVKMCSEKWFHIEPLVNLAVITSILGGACVGSLMFPSKKGNEHKKH